MVFFWRIRTTESPSPNRSAIVNIDFLPETRKSELHVLKSFKKIKTDSKKNGSTESRNAREIGMPSLMQRFDSIGQGRTSRTKQKGFQEGSREGSHRLSASVWGTQLTVEQLGSLSAFIKHLSDKIDSGLTYKDELVSQGEMGKVSVEFEVDAFGVLLRMNELSFANSPKLTGLVLQVLEKSLATPLEILSPIERVSLILDVDFLIVHTSDLVKANETTISGTKISMFRLEHRDSSYDITSFQFDENLFTKLFGRKKELSQELWNFNTHTESLGRMCEIELNGITCHRAAANYQKLGQF